jgi:heme/copper-type cytochrome/quinol oxidase subunit 3
MSVAEDKARQARTGERRGVIYLGFILSAAARGRYSAHNWNSVEIVGLCWHFVDLIWILVFTFVYLI